MILEEKQNTIRQWCRGRGCSECPLFILSGSCADKESVERNYQVLVDNGYIPGEKTPKSPKRLKTDGNPVDHPDHYNQGEIECIDAMIAAFGKEKVCDWCVMTSFKYHWRYQHKNGDEDICKASWYIDKYKELREVGEA